MVWIALGCMLGGFAVGWISRSALSVTLTSAQIVLLALALTLAGQIGWGECAFWTIIGLFAHQSAFLGAVILHSWREDRCAERRRPDLSDEIDANLAVMDSLACNMRRKAPEVAPEAKDLSALVARMRRQLDSPGALEDLLQERRRRQGFPTG